MNYPLTLVARFVAGVAAGLAWALLSATPAGWCLHQEGRASRCAMAGSPSPVTGRAGRHLPGQVVSWQAAFLVMTRADRGPARVDRGRGADYPGQQAGGKPMRSTLRVPGVAAVLTITLVFVLAHTLRTPTSPASFSTRRHGRQVTAALLVFGVACLIGIWVVGTTSTATCANPQPSSARCWSASPSRSWARSPAATPWSTSPPPCGALGWGGVPTLLLQTAGGQAGGEAAEAAQAMLYPVERRDGRAGGHRRWPAAGRRGPRPFPWTRC